MSHAFCPLCKCDARIINGEPPVTKCTPLLSTTSLLASPIPSAQSSFIGSPSIHASPFQWYLMMNRWDCSETVLCSAKENIEVYEILEAIVKKKPPPQDNTEKSFEGSYI
jgi:hypothetical protein